MTVLIILGILFLALVIVIPLLEKSSFRMSEQDISKLSRFILPGVLILAIIQFISMMF